MSTIRHIEPAYLHSGLGSYFTQDVTNNGTLCGKKITLGIAAISGATLTIISGLALQGLILVSIAASYKLGIFISGLVLTSMSLSLLADLRDDAIHNRNSPATTTNNSGSNENPSTAPNLRDINNSYVQAAINLRARQTLPPLPNSGTGDDPELAQAMAESRAAYVDPNFFRSEDSSTTTRSLPDFEALGSSFYEIRPEHKWNLTFLEEAQEASDQEIINFFNRPEYLQYYPTNSHESAGVSINPEHLRRNFINHAANTLNRSPLAKRQLKQIVRKFLDRDPSSENYERDLESFITRVTGIYGHCSANEQDQLENLHDQYVQGDISGGPNERFKKAIYKFLYDYRREIFSNVVGGVAQDRNDIHYANTIIYYKRTQQQRYGLHFPGATHTTHEGLRIRDNRNGISMEECIAHAFDTEYTKEKIITRFLNHFNNPRPSREEPDPVRRLLTTDVLNGWIQRTYGVDPRDSNQAQQLYDFDEDLMPTSLKANIITLILMNFQILQAV